MDNKSAFPDVGPTWTASLSREGLNWLHQPVEAKPRYAGFWRRFAAVIIDGVLLGIVAKIADAIVWPAVEHYLGARVTASWPIQLTFIVGLFILYCVVDWLYYAIQ